ncbi:proto-oncogene Mas-like [Elgaria multicarinata webbii]|uniref:proto-oncogene Mas-like n=1 Tax=Elgaria multicarinata webbii TaxID=159646 RepID=UPI002FCCC50F
MGNDATSYSFEDSEQNFLNTYNLTEIPNVFTHEDVIISSFLLMISLFGLLGNGTVIRLLGFHMKRNSFTIYILNLAVADFAVLIALMLRAIDVILIAHQESLNLIVMVAFGIIFFFMYNTSQLLLTAISIERCVAVWFPIWHQCHRPPKLSTIVCALIWVLSLILCGIHIIVIAAGCDPLVHAIVTILICYPLMATSTLTLFVKICFTQKKQKRTKTLTVILLALLFCLIFGIPPAIYTVFVYYHGFRLVLTFENIVCLCACLNSSINPMLYFFAGRGKKVQSRVSLRDRLQRVFFDEQDHREGEGPPD